MFVAGQKPEVNSIEYVITVLGFTGFITLGTSQPVVGQNCSTSKRIVF